MDNITKYISYFILIILAIFGLIIAYIIIINLIPISNPTINFDGTSESYIFTGKYCSVRFDSDVILFASQNKHNATVFRLVKNITVDNWNGEIIAKNGSHIQFNYNENRTKKNQIILQNINVNIFFDNLTLHRDNNYIQIEGNISRYHVRALKSNGNNKITIPNTHIKSIYINDETITDFKTISFEMDNSSYVDLIPGKINLNGERISEFNLNGQLSKNMNIDKSEGTLKLDDKTYDINNDEIDIEINSNYPTSLNFINSKLEFSGTVISANLNDNNLIRSNIIYWFDQQPEKINALAALFLAFVTGIYVFTTIGILEHTKASVEQTGKIIEQTKIGRRFDNIEKLLMYVYSPMDTIFTKFNLSHEYYSQSVESDEIHNEYNRLFIEMNDGLFEIKRNYGYLFDSDLIQRHNEVLRLWNQYLNSDDSEKKTRYNTLNSRISALHDLINNKINTAKDNREEINNSFNS